MAILNINDNFPGYNLSINETAIANRICRRIVQVRIFFKILLIEFFIFLPLRYEKKNFLAH